MKLPPWQEVHNEASPWIDYRQNKEVLNETIPSVPKDENSFDAVAIIKWKMDEYNLYYIYRVNNGLCNNTSDYVFKSSREMVGIAIIMDINNPEANPLQFKTATSMPHTNMYKASSRLDYGHSILQ